MKERLISLAWAIPWMLFMGFPLAYAELRPETWTRLMVAVMRLPVGPGPGILPGSGP